MTDKAPPVTFILDRTIRVLESLAVFTCYYWIKGRRESKTPGSDADNERAWRWSEFYVLYWTAGTLAAFAVLTFFPNFVSKIIGILLFVIGAIRIHALEGGQRLTALFHALVPHAANT